MRGARKRSAQGADEIGNARHAALQIHGMADPPARAGSALENKRKRSAPRDSLAPGRVPFDGIQRFSCARAVLADREVRGMVLDALHEGRQLRRLYWCLSA
jgi:hypothetical protein